MHNEIRQLYFLQLFQCGVVGYGKTGVSVSISVEKRRKNIDLVESHLPPFCSFDDEFEFLEFG